LRLFACVTTEQGTDPQLDQLRAAGCDTVLEQHASVADRSRPVLARLLRDIAAGETLVVVRLVSRSALCRNGHRFVPVTSRVRIGPETTVLVRKSAASDRKDEDRRG
jgi:hypothetical protein